MKILLMSAVCLAWLVPGGLRGADFSWVNPHAGDWFDDANWSAMPPAIPGSGDDVSIGEGEADVAGAGSAAANTIQVEETGILTVRQGAVLTVEDALNLHGGGQATLSGLHSAISASGVVIGGTAGVASLTLSDGGTLTVGSGTGTLTVGQAGGTGVLHVGSSHSGSPTAAGLLNAEGVVLSTSADAIHLNHSGSTTFSASISGEGYVVKRGPGTTLMTGGSSYEGGTLIESGTLIVDGIIGDVVVQNGGTLQGDGSVGDVELQAGSHLVPVDCMWAGDVIWNPGATMEFALTGYEGDNLLEMGTLKKNGSGTYAFTFTDAGWEVGLSYLLIVFSDLEGFTVGDFEFTNGNGFDGVFEIEDSTVRFTLTAVPEPTSLAVWGAGLMLVGLCRRRTVRG